MNARRVVVTGAAGHLGRAVCRRFALAGAEVIGIDVRRPDPEEGAFRVADLASAGGAAAVFGEILSSQGRVDALLNVAGGFQMAAATAPEPWEALWRLNVQTVLHATGAVLPSMLARGAGVIVNVAARAEPARAGMAAYCASKSAVIRFTEALADEVKHQGVRVNCVMPGILDTPANRAAMPAADFATWVAPQALAEVLLFLCGAGAGAIHGAAIPVTGLT